MSGTPSSTTTLYCWYRHWWNLAALTIVVLAVVCSGLLMWSLVRDRAEHARLRAMLAPYERGERNFPSAEREAFLTAQQKTLDGIMAELRQYPLFAEQIIAPDQYSMSPLKFKEKVFTVKSELRQQALKMNVALPKDIGFATWERELPAPETLQDLYQALEVVRQILEKAIASRLKEIVSVSVTQLSPTVYPGIDKGPATQQYFTRDIALVVEGPSTKVMAFMQALSNVPLLMAMREVTISIKQEEAQRTAGKVTEIQKAGPAPDSTAVSAEPVVTARCTVTNVFL